METNGAKFWRFACRRGDWKLTDVGDGIWRLFDIARDPGETRDLSLGDPDGKAELVAAWDRYAQQVGVTLPDFIPYRSQNALMIRFGASGLVNHIS